MATKPKTDPAVAARAAWIAALDAQVWTPADGHTINEIAAFWNRGYESTRRLVAQMVKDGRATHPGHRRVGRHWVAVYRLTGQGKP